MTYIDPPRLLSVFLQLFVKPVVKIELIDLIVGLLEGYVMMKINFKTIISIFRYIIWDNWPFTKPEINCEAANASKNLRTHTFPCCWPHKK